ncbi:hypothetical protein JCM19274_4202 [Algibacter lectus]|uniref:Uncharacterized protein n=1 Tax=Algibacter lectus TaxID=221126 RepID=A0A090X590_9FLAO|nr:hypothetical protein JCM19274_4202 [Algibacter lectus]
MKSFLFSLKIKRLSSESPTLGGERPKVFEAGIWDNINFYCFIFY